MPLLNPPAHVFRFPIVPGLVMMLEALELSWSLEEELHCLLVEGPCDVVSTLAMSVGVLPLAVCPHDLHDVAGRPATQCERPLNRA